MLTGLWQTDASGIVHTSRYDYALHIRRAAKNCFAYLGVISKVKQRLLRKALAVTETLVLNVQQKNYLVNYNAIHKTVHI